MIKKLISRVFLWATDDIFDEGYDKGIDVGYRLAEYRFKKLIQNEINHVSEPMMVDREYLDGLERALEIIAGAEG